MQFAPALLAALRQARQVAVLTGAGVSAESGVPTFRQAQSGLWAQYRPEDLATPEAFRHNPRLVWEWYASRRERLAQVQPNPGHFALAEMQRRVPQLTLITQNVDGLHQQAGSQGVIELHGSIQRVKCFEKNHPIDSWALDGEVPPRCPRCGGLLRPDVVWFGEALPQEALQAAIRAADTCDIFFSVGTSGVVYPAAALPYHALEHGALVVEINPEATPIREIAAHTLCGPSGEILPELVQAAWPNKGYNHNTIP